MLLLGVKETDAAELTKTNHPFGWLLKVLQNEHADKETMMQTLHEVFAQLDTFHSMTESQRRNAILYLSYLVLYRRHDNEQSELRASTNTYNG